MHVTLSPSFDKLTDGGNCFWNDVRYTLNPCCLWIIYLNHPLNKIFDTWNGELPKNREQMQCSTVSHCFCFDFISSFVLFFLSAHSALSSTVRCVNVSYLMRKIFMMCINTESADELKRSSDLTFVFLTIYIFMCVHFSMENETKIKLSIFYEHFDGTNSFCMVCIDSHSNEATKKKIQRN